MQIKEILQKKLTESFIKCDYDVLDVQVSFSNKPEMADYQCNSAFVLAKKLRLTPMIIANRIIENFDNSDELFEVSFAAPAFINFRLTKKALNSYANECLSDDRLGLPYDADPQTIVFDYGGANIAKELHVGHLRSPIVGESLARLYKLFGHKVITDTHLGDWGTQMGLTMAQMQDDGYLSFYFGGKNKAEITLDTLNEEYPKASKRKEREPEFKARALEITAKLQKYEEPWYTIYKDIKEISIAKIKENYGKLNCYFDVWYGESDAQPYIDRTVEAFTSQNLARISDGALVVDVAVEGENIPGKITADGVQLYNNPMPPLMLKKSDDASAYAITDLATIIQRNELFKPNKIIYITDYRQAQHFTQVFRAAKLSGISPIGQDLVHVGFGTINGTDGKPFKTRDGGRVKLEDILNTISTSANRKLTENNIENNPKLALDIGVAAIKFGDLSNAVGKDYVFDLDRFMSFEGKTGPYLQYTGARIKSLIEKSDKKFGKITIENLDERNIIINLIKLMDSYKVCKTENSMNALCLAVYNLASSYSTLYNNCKILTNTDAEKRASLLSLSKLVLEALKQAFYVLAIEMPDKM